MTDKIKWNARYSTQDTPWETGVPHPEAIRLFTTYCNKGSNILEVGCGSGMNAQWLYENGYNVTAIDISDEAIQIAKKNNNKIDFMCMDFLHDENILSNYSAIFDCAVLQVLAKEQRSDFVKAVHKHSEPNGYWINISCSADHAQEIESQSRVKAPPYLTAEKIISITEPFFELIEMKRCNFYIDRKDVDIVRFNAWGSVFKKRS